ncbi:hypothetical protein H8L47_19350 [Undibacterium sp. NL8W]|uniref:Uncharacterized protein n=1 Tax=Undibacterium umbellatum TaxID=2762300 RepID=A0ABR6ZDA0_9BURK|nr:hypothetical protein [Undibacterium umbellatum]
MHLCKPWSTLQSSLAQSRGTQHTDLNQEVNADAEQQQSKRRLPGQHRAVVDMGIA